MFAIEVGCGQPADAAANDDKIVSLVGSNRLSGFRPEVSVTHAVRGLKSSGMTAAHSSQGWWIVARCVLRGRDVARLPIREPRASQRTTGGESHAIQGVCRVMSRCQYSSAFAVARPFALLFTRVSHSSPRDLDPCPSKLCQVTAEEWVPVPPSHPPADRSARVATRS